MGDYPDPEEEYELMYADDFELMRETEEDSEPNTIKKKSFQAKRSLDFSSPVSKKSKELASHNVSLENSESMELTPGSTPVNNSGKRTVNELFGDINDIDFDEVALPSKKQKTEEENDLELIDKILQERKLKQLIAEPTGRKHLKEAAYDIKDNVSLDIPRWAFLPLTNSDGQRMYIKLEPEDVWESTLSCSAVKSSLWTTYTGVWEEAKKILEKKKEDQTRLESQLTQPLLDAEENNGTKLWVDKYRPDSYVDLLSEEPVNRALLHWLHLWDKIVFKKEIKVKDPQQRTAFSKRTGQFQLTNRWKGKKDTEPEVDEDGRPHHKVALLCGPPGVGKTTLAHLLAKLAGYRPVELNASDERSVEAFRSALQSATLMRSVIDAERRPNCLILDEIDGAPLPTVELLVKWCTASASDAAKKKGKLQPLKRPVIAICNDLYAPALRPLRAVSLIIHVGGVTARRLSSRLAAVARCERLHVSAHILSALTRRAAGDVRAAIQVLSFIKARSKEQLTMQDVENANIGEKDCHKSLIQALQAVFTTNDVPEPVTACLGVINSHGEYDRIIEGIFENYLEARVDARLILACETLEWLRIYDLINSWIQKYQNYSLYSMLPLCAAACHRVLASRNPPKIKYPQKAQEVYRNKLEIESILDGVSRGCAPSVRVGVRALLLDVLPMLPYLLAPKLRSNNIQLCSDHERKSVRNAAAAMCDYGLQYVQQRTQDGLYAFVMEPDIYRLAFFGSEEQAKAPPAVRQTIAREQQMEEIRRTEAMSGRVINKPATDMKVKSMENHIDDPPARLPNHLQRLQPKAVKDKVAPQVQKDFFGRIVPIVESSQRSDGVRDLISTSSVFYQYREGFNNAVRRSVKTRDLL